MSMRRKILRNSFKKKFNVRKYIAWRMRYHARRKNVDD
jgi:hypothetical protein